MTFTSAFLIAIKSLIVLIPLLFLIRFGLVHLNDKNEACAKEVRMKFDMCASELSNFEEDYLKWEFANFAAQQEELIAKLKLQCQEIPKCFQNMPSNCKSTLPIVEHFPVWCRRIYFLSGDFAKCAGKVNQISGRSQCANEFFNLKYFAKPKDVKCEILGNGKECILESVTKTCAKTMTEVLKKHINTEQSIIRC